MKPREETWAGIIMMGVNAMYPTLAITESPNDGKIHFEKTGKVAIGSVVPQSKLHIQSDSGEDAGITLESGNKNTDSAYVRFQYADRYISVGTDNRMRVSAGNNDLHLIAGRYCLNSDATYLANEGDRVLLIRSPRALFLRSNNVTLLGKVGINTENNTSAYALAVDGGIITTKVYIQDVDDWPDHVFDGAYRLMPLHELKKYIVNKVGRGVTYWTGYGGFTDKPVQVLCVCLNKYEIASLRQAMAEIDPHAFVIVDEGVSTTGNFERHLA